MFLIENRENVILNQIHLCKNRRAKIKYEKYIN